MKNNNVLGRRFTFGTLLKFAFPTIVMMVFMSLYTMVDGVFVARLISTNALSAVNIVFPVVSVLLAVGIMLATGGSAIVARKLGENNPKEAMKNFSLFALVGVALGAVISVATFLTLDPLLRFLGANEAIFELCRSYAVVLVWFAVPAILQMYFQTFFVTAGRPGLGLAITVVGGLSNIVLDYVFIAHLHMGIAGAAWATGIGYSIPALYGVYFFIRAGKGAEETKGSLYFSRPTWDAKALLQACTNGSSEMVTNLSSAVVTYLFNVAMMRYAGENGVAAITIVLYAQFLLTAVYLGYSGGVAPVISYNYGNGNSRQLKRLFRISMIFLGVGSVVTYAAANLFAGNIAGVFAPAGSDVYRLAVEGFRVFSACFLFMGVNIFASAMYTAFSNGAVSAGLSFLRTFVFIVLGIVFLPQVIGMTGIWVAVPFAELLAFLTSLACFVKLRSVYQYA